MRSTTLAEPLLLELQRALLDAAPSRSCASELPGRSSASTATRGPPLTTSSRPRVRRGQARRRHPAIQAPANTRALTGDRPRAHGPLREGAAPRPQRDPEEALVPPRSGRREAGASRRACRSPTSAAFVARALFLDQPDPVAARGASCARSRTRSSRAWRGRRAAHRGPGTELELCAKGRGGSTPTAGATCPRARSSPGPHEASANGHVTFGVRSSPAGVEVAGVSSSCATARSWPRTRAAARTTCTARWRPTRAPGASARSASARTSASTGRSARSSSTRRSAARCTSRSGARIPSRAARTRARCTGT